MKAQNRRIHKEISQAAMSTPTKGAPYNNNLYSILDTDSEEEREEITQVNATKASANKEKTIELEYDAESISIKQLEEELGNVGAVKRGRRTGSPNQSN